MSLKRPQALLAAASLLTGAAVASMLLNLYGDVRRKMTEEFKAYGANVVLAPKVRAANFASSSLSGSGENAALSEGALSRLRMIFVPPRGITAVPALYVVVRVHRIPPDLRLADFENMVAVGTDFAALRQMYPGWRITGAPSALGAEECAVGSRAAARLRVGAGDSVRTEVFDRATDDDHAKELATPGLSDTATANPARSEQNSGRQYRVANVVTVGGPEDDQLFLSLPELQQLAGMGGKTSLIQLSVPGDPQEIEHAIQELAKAFPDLDVRPIRQIVYSEGKVLGTIRGLLLALTGLILAVMLLCVAATTTAIVLEHRNDIAVMKALGASNRFLAQLFMSESAGLGLIGGLAGCALGALVARGLGRHLFGVSLGVVWWTVPVVVAGSMLLASLATLSVVRIVRGIQPAVVLKGE